MDCNSFVIEGGHKLHGSIRPQGAKNEALQVICASLLTDEEVAIDNVPDISDIRNLIILLQSIGVSVTRRGRNAYTFRADSVDTTYTGSSDFVRGCGAFRGSMMIVGPLLTRFGSAHFPKPGGDQIGRRRIDTHIVGLTSLGADVEYDMQLRSFYLHVPEGGRLKGTYILQDEASVTGTANVVMAASLAQGKTTIYNAACEPYIQQLCRLLNAMGAQIEGIGSNLLTINGVERLHGASHTVLPDMVEIGSYIGMAALNRSSITIENVSYANLGIIPECFRRLGIFLEQREDDIFIPEQEHYEIDSFLDGSIMTIADAPWPGLTPDLLSVMLVVATQCRGSVLIHQKMFESRLFFVDKLIDMGAQVILCDPHRAVVIGHDHEVELKASKILSPDIRAGIALLIAAMSARGTSVMSNIEQIDRGYEDIDARLNALGARISRE
ncbi:MAG: UDP-N-acetylglucosamine 1-carboxyvinyltransferase [Bacteroidales bacterium]|nr:UDP-N-acetylglucosamine 1-carboxyvinyltransferase [Bacteroidales bacterium]